MTYKVGAKGQVVLPKELRERHGIRPGDEVLFDERDGEIRIRRAESGSPLRGMLRDEADPLPLTQAVEADHRWEIAHDEMREAEWEIRDVSRRPG